MANRNGFDGKSKRMQLTKRAESFDAVDRAADAASVAPGVSPKITAAEQRVLALVAHARTNKEIAMDLNISPATVKRHIEKILKKLGLRNRVEAAICGLMLNGCPQQSSSGCVVRKLITEGATVADGPID